MGVADFGAGGARAFSSGFPGTLDQATVRGKILHPWEARDIMDFVEQHEAENLADPRAPFAADTGCWRHGAWRF